MIPLRLYLYAALVLGLIGGAWYLHHAGYVAGVAHEAAIVAKQDKAAAEAAQKREAALRDAYNTLAQRYEQDKANAQTEHDRAVATLHTLRLRDKWACPGVPSTTTTSRERDAAATQALADRTAAAIRIVRLGYDADQREAYYRAQVTALQSILTAERQP